MIYEYFCPTCNARRDIIKPLSELERQEACLLCDAVMLRQICAPAVVGDLQGYDCPITGQRIEGRRAHQENLAKHGCRLLEPGETAAAARRRDEADRKLDQALDREVGQAITALPDDKRQKLEAEMSHNIGLGVTRSTWNPA